MRRSQKKTISDFGTVAYEEIKLLQVGICLCLWRVSKYTYSKKYRQCVALKKRQSLIRDSSLIEKSSRVNNVVVYLRGGDIKIVA